jgi:hypothetical protein
MSSISIDNIFFFLALIFYDVTSYDRSFFHICIRYVIYSLLFFFFFFSCSCNEWHLSPNSSHFQLGFNMMTSSVPFEYISKPFILSLIVWPFKCFVYACVHNEHEKKLERENVCKKRKERDNYTYSKFNACIYVFVNLLFVIDKTREEKKNLFFVLFCSTYQYT